MDKAAPSEGVGTGPAARVPDHGPQPDSPPFSYQIQLAPGPDTLRRGVNPLGVLDELRNWANRP